MTYGFRFPGQAMNKKIRCEQYVQNMSLQNGCLCQWPHLPPEGGKDLILWLSHSYDVIIVLIFSSFCNVLKFSPMPFRLEFSCLAFVCMCYLVSLLLSQH